MASSTRHGHRMRCSRCLTRFRLKKHPDLYVRMVRCPDCDSYTVYSTEASRRREVARQETCYCTMFPFPHRKGSMIMCRNHPDRVAGMEPTQVEIDEYHGCLATPRSGVG